MGQSVGRVVLAFSGGLDTSVILKWLQQHCRCEVVTFTADVGQSEEIGPARRKAELLGVRPKASAHVADRSSPSSLYDERIATFEKDSAAYRQSDAEGLIRSNALRLRLLARRDARARS